MITFPRLEPGKHYHVFNRGNNKENLFREPCNYEYFLSRVWHQLVPAVSILAYCLLRNHFHFALRVRDWGEQLEWARRNRPKLLVPILKRPLDPSLQLSHLFNGYAKAMNKRYGRIGSLFQERFRRVELETGQAIRAVVQYIHANPQNHGLVEDYRLYQFSSYTDILLARSVIVEPDATLAWFGGKDGFLFEHEHPGDSLR